jgi:hypothetical protein
MVVVEGEESPSGHGPYFSGQSCDKEKLPVSRFEDTIVLKLPSKDDDVLGVTGPKALRQRRQRLAP